MNKHLFGVHTAICKPLAANYFRMLEANSRLFLGEQGGFNNPYVETRDFDFRDFARCATTRQPFVSQTGQRLYRQNDAVILYNQRTITDAIYNKNFFHSMCFLWRLIACKVRRCYTKEGKIPREQMVPPVMLREKFGSQVHEMLVTECGTSSLALLNGADQLFIGLLVRERIEQHEPDVPLDLDSISDTIRLCTRKNWDEF